jgi:hypothetical protein
LLLFFPVIISIHFCLIFHLFHFFFLPFIFVFVGVGFLLEPANWGFFGYLGASDTAWSYDAHDGAIVSATDALHEHLPTIKTKGVVTVK